jgi:hypothetical protein
MDFKEFPGHDRITRRSGVRLQPATLSEGIRPGEDGRKATVAETDEQLGYRAAYDLTNLQRFENWSGYYRRNAEQRTASGLTVELVKELDDSRGEPNGYDGDYEQGSEGKIGLVFKVTAPDGRVVHLKKEGYADSYGTKSWDGPLRIVQPQTKTVIEYVY